MEGIEGWERPYLLHISEDVSTVDGGMSLGCRTFLEDLGDVRSRGGRERREKEQGSMERNRRRRRRRRGHQKRGRGATE